MPAASALGRKAASRIATICAIASVCASASSASHAQLPPPTLLKSRPVGAAAPASAAAATPNGSSGAAVANPAAVPYRPHRHRPWRDRAAVLSAYQQALAAPRPSSFVNANLVYPFEANRVYKIDASPRFLTVIALRPGEKLISKAAGDTVRWVIGETAGGEDAGGLPQTLVLVKPLEGGQVTNIVLTTDQRVYLIEAVSHDEPIFTTMVSWHYPADEMRELELTRAVATVQTLARQANVVDNNLNVSRLNFDYAIAPAGAAAGGFFHGAHPPRWSPVRVFDDGSKTYIQFPPALTSSDAPPLFLAGPHDSAQLVNYRFSNGYYVVDRLFDVAELRLGAKPQTVVRITFTGTRSAFQ